MPQIVSLETEDEVKEDGGCDGGGRGRFQWLIATIHCGWNQKLQSCWDHRRGKPPACS